jgi:hypothetical protein
MDHIYTRIQIQHDPQIMIYSVLLSTKNEEKNYHSTPILSKKNCSMAVQISKETMMDWNSFCPPFLYK